MRVRTFSPIISKLKNMFSKKTEKDLTQGHRLWGEEIMNSTYATKRTQVAQHLPMTHSWKINGSFPPEITANVSVLCNILGSSLCCFYSKNFKTTLATQWEILQMEISGTPTLTWGAFKTQRWETHTSCSQILMTTFAICVNLWFPKGNKKIGLIQIETLEHSVLGLHWKSEGSAFWYWFKLSDFSRDYQPISGALMSPFLKLSDLWGFPIIHGLIFERCFILKSQVSRKDPYSTQTPNQEE